MKELGEGQRLQNRAGDRRSAGQGRRQDEGYPQDMELPKGGRQFDKCSLQALLTNPTYSVKIMHKTDPYQGQHQAIVDEQVFDRVQSQLRENGFNRGNRMPSKHGGLLKGHIRCPNCNVAMVHNMTKRNFQRDKPFKTLRFYDVCPGGCLGERPLTVGSRSRDTANDVPTDCRVVLKSSSFSIVL